MWEIQFAIFWYIARPDPMLFRCRKNRPPIPSTKKFFFCFLFDDHIRNRNRFLGTKNELKTPYV